MFKDSWTPQRQDEIRIVNSLYRHGFWTIARKIESGFWTINSDLTIEQRAENSAELSNELTEEDREILREFVSGCLPSSGFFRLGSKELAERCLDGLKDQFREFQSKRREILHRHLENSSLASLNCAVPEVLEHAVPEG